MQARQSRIEVALSDHVVYIRVIGLATMHNCGALSEFCNAELDVDCREVVFDLRQCTGMDSTFMGVMAGLALRYQDRPEPVAVVNADEHCRTLMEGLGLSHIVNVHAEAVDIPQVEGQELREDWATEQERLQCIMQAHENLVRIDQRNKERFGRFLHAFTKQQGGTMVKFAICNEFCQEWPIDRVFKLAADTGYQGVEIAPFTLAADVRDIPAQRRREIAQQAADCGVDIVGLHWLLVSPEGLYVNHPDKAIRDATAVYFKELIRLCGDLGGTKMVIGSPKQRNVYEGLTPQQAWDYAKEVFVSLLPDAEKAGVDLCIEPLSRSDTDFIITGAQALKLVKEIGHPRFLVHLDVKAMADEERPMDEIIKECEGYVGHFHANDANRSYPGSGDTDFGPVAAGLKAIGYDQWVSVEVFNFEPTPETIAGESIKYLKEKFGV